MAQTVKLVRTFRHADYAVVYWKENGFQPYVACWCPRVKEEGRQDYFPLQSMVGLPITAYWGQGHYFENLEDAIKYAVDKEKLAIESEIEWLEDELNIMDMAISEEAMAGYRKVAESNRRR